MISLEQILLLQNKVQEAVQKIATLEEQKKQLEEKCSNLQEIIEEKTKQLELLQIDQSKIESGIVDALGKLNAVEHCVLQNAPKEDTKDISQLESPTATQNTAPIIQDKPSINEQQIEKSQETPSFQSTGNKSNMQTIPIVSNTEPTQTNQNYTSKDFDTDKDASLIKNNIDTAQQKSNDTQIIEPQVDFTHSSSNIGITGDSATDNTVSHEYDDLPGPGLFDIF